MIVGPMRWRWPLLIHSAAAALLCPFAVEELAGRQWQLQQAAAAAAAAAVVVVVGGGGASSTWPVSRIIISRVQQ
jgi:hypothetical protein